jgi:hypothetical protein
MLRFLIILFSLFTAHAAKADSYFVAKSGDDNNDCLSDNSPCATWQHAIDLCPGGPKACAVSVAAGVYIENPSVNYYKMVVVTGDCASITAVTLKGTLYGQDHSIVGIQCAQVKAISTRQYAIMDHFFVTFADNPGGFHISANESSKINCLSAEYISGDAAYHLGATGMSQISSNCTVTLLGETHTFSAFGYAVRLSYINANDIMVNGTSVGAKCIVDATSVIDGSVSFPGFGSC